MWPFTRKNDGADPVGTEKPEGTGVSGAPGPTEPSVSADSGAAASGDGSSAPTHDPVNGDFGPFDGDKVDYSTFDYSDFAKSGLDLGSLRVPVPHDGEVQVEMGPKGPQMIHILTPFGRLTPVALAAPRTGRQWEESIPEVTEGMSADGLEVEVTKSLWGPEVVGTMKAGTMRVIGVDGPRWMLRMTLAGPADKADQLAELAYEVISRTFVYRGQEPLPAGQSLPVTIPAAMAEELRKVIEQRQKDAAEAKPEGGE
ncbi:DUF3710 domain-containing protein [Corynebacterium sp.]|uniref:DUF3710 domain-containing protein n=1 Tax=Corynebacterium sp. TaxID=1720 RepID=UPI003B3AA22C